MQKFQAFSLYLVRFWVHGSGFTVGRFALFIFLKHVMNPRKVLSHRDSSENQSLRQCYASMIRQHLVSVSLIRSPSQILVSSQSVHFSSQFICQLPSVHIFKPFTPHLSLTLVCDSATLESLFRSNWPLRRSEAALNVEP